MSAGTLQSKSDNGSSSPLLVVDHLTLYFPVKKGVLLDHVVARVRAVDDVSFTLRAQETLGVVGESGCGKTTLAHCLLHLLTPTSGSIYFRGQDVASMKGASLKDFRRQVQMVFQDPQSSLNPRKRIGQIISSGLDLRGVERPKVGPEIRHLLRQVGLDPDHVNRFPHEFSGGQRQTSGHRPGDCGKAQPGGSGRAGVRLGRVCPSAGYQPAQRPPTRVPPCFYLHRTQPGGGAARVRPDRGYVPGQDRRALAGGPAVPQASASVYRGTAICHSGPRSEGPGLPPRCGQGRTA